jgi:hypothetical protein
MEVVETPLTPSDIAEGILESLENDHAARVFDPWSQNDLLDLARLARAFGIEGEARAGLEVPAADPPLKDDEIADWIRTQVSPHPARFAEMVEACQLIEAYRQKKEAASLEGCGEPYGRVVRLFWRDRKGRERMRMVGLHSCKNRHCPRCGRQKQLKRTVLMEKVLELAAEWGMDERNVRKLWYGPPHAKIDLRLTGCVG